MIIIADGGSTKTSWCQIDNEGSRSYFQTEGYNPYFVDSTYILDSLQRSISDVVDTGQVFSVYFYGAGCSEDKSIVVKTALENVFPNAEISIAMDLLAAARALLGRAPGFAAILGTGTNTCLYDGKEIVKNIDSLGFILGDEGSAGAMGKRLLGDYIRGGMPHRLTIKFAETYQLTHDEIVDRIYTKPMPNRFCAGFSKFLYENRDEEYARSLIKSSFVDFFQKLVSRYDDYESYSFNCIGSVASSFKEILEETAKEFNMKPGRIIRQPIDDLAAFHSSMKVLNS